MPKRSLLTYYFRRAAIDGMTDPYFLEVIVNPDVLDFERPFVVAHEWAHLAGYSNEAEANFLAWLTCIKGRLGSAVQRLARRIRACARALCRGAIARPQRRSTRGRARICRRWRRGTRDRRRWCAAPRDGVYDEYSQGQQGERRDRELRRGASD